MSAAAIEIRELTPDDAAPFLALRLRALRDHPEAFGASYQEWRDRTVADVAPRLADPSGPNFGAFDGGELVGTLRVARGSGLKERHKASIYGMYVAPEARRRGVARRLIEVAIARARSWPEVEEVRLSVSAGTAAARALYAALGFQVWGVEPRALKVGGKYVAEEHMVFLLQRDE